MDLLTKFHVTASISEALTEANFFYDQTCAADAECGQLQSVFLRAFNLEETLLDDDDDLEVHRGNTLARAAEELMDQFADTIHPLVRGITKRMNATAVHCVWVRSAQIIAKSWSAKLATLENDSEVLRYLLTAWHAFQDAINLIHSLAVYAQNHLVSTMVPPNTRVRSLINEMCCAIFVEHFLGTSKDHIFQALLAGIKNDVKNESNEETVRAVLQLLLHLDAQQTVYYRVFAFPYLLMLQRAHSTVPTIASPDEAISYLKQVEQTIETNISTASKFSFTLPFVRMIAKLLYAQLIESHRLQVCSYSIFAEMVSSQSYAQLRYLYQIVKYDAESVKILAANIELYLSSQLNATRRSDYKQIDFAKEHAIKFVQDIHYIYQVWLDDSNSIASTSFANCAQAREAIIAAISDYLNSDPIYCCLLSLYVHLASLDCTLWSIDPAIKLLTLIDDKQAITEYARYFLCNRIVLRLSLEPEKDVAAIGRVLESLQIESPFSVKLILKNYKNSICQLKDQSLVERYKQPFQVRLLNGLWKLDTDPNTQTFRLPRSFWAMYNSFRRDFALDHPKKVLQLNRNYGSAKMLAHFNGRRTTYQFVASLRQAVVMLLFNRHASLSFEQLKSQTKLDTDSLLQCVRLFLKYGLLLRVNSEEEREDEEEEENGNLMESTFEIQDKFSHCTADKVGLSISVNKLEKKANSSNASGIIQINWIKLQHECCPNFDLAKIMVKCTGDSSHDEPAPTDAKSSKADASKQPGSKEAVNHEQAEANSPANTFRLEAAVVRVMKRATVVGDLKTLQDLTLEALSATPWSGQQRSPRQLALSVPIPALKKCVDSLEKNGYLRRLSGGEIVYEP